MLTAAYQPYEKEHTMKSEDVVVQAPMSFTGSRARIWKMVRRTGNPVVRWTLAIPTALLAVAAAWCAVAGWYLLFGLFLGPYRLVRRGSRKRKREALRHREMLDAVERHQGRGGTA